MLCTMLGVKHLTTKAYHSRINAQVELYSRTIVTRLRSYVANKSERLDKYVQTLVYAYNTQVQKFTNIALFGLVLSPHPPGVTTVSQKPSLTTDSHVETDLRWLRLKL